MQILLKFGKNQETKSATFLGKTSSSQKKNITEFAYKYNRIMGWKSLLSTEFAEIDIMF